MMDSFDWQLAVVLAVVAAAGGLLLLRLIRVVRGQSSGACGGCSGCGPQNRSTADGAGNARVIPFEAISLPGDSLPTASGRDA